MAKMDNAELLQKLGAVYKLQCPKQIFAHARESQGLLNPRDWGIVDYDEYVRTGKSMLPPYIRCELREKLMICVD